MKLTMTRDTIVNGSYAGAGTVVDVADGAGRRLVLLGKATEAITDPKLAAEKAEAKDPHIEKAVPGGRRKKQS